MGIFDTNKNLGHTSSKSKSTIISEEYFGDNIYILKMQDALSALRKKYYGTSKFSIKINSDPLLFEFNRRVEEAFGFKVFSLHVLQEGIHNACTIPLSLAIEGHDNPNMVETTKYGYRFKKSAGLSTKVFISASILLNDEFTDREVMAIILHEIGHNFSSKIMPYLCITTGIKRLVLLIIYISQPLAAIPNTLSPTLTAQSGATLSNEIYGKCIALSEKLRKEDNISVKTLDFMRAILGALKYGATEIINIFNIAINLSGLSMASVVILILDAILSILQNPLTTAFKLGGYNDERVADNFATIYGYGSDLASALDKLEDTGFGMKTEKFVRDLPIIGPYYRLMTAIPQLLIWLVDPHPTTISRIGSQIKYLKTELEKEETDPKMKREIKKDLDEIEKLMDKSYRNIKSDDPNYFAAKFKLTLFTLYGGDPRDLVDRGPLNGKFDTLSNKTRI